MKEVKTICPECMILGKFINILKGKGAEFGVQESTVFKESLRKSEGKKIRKRKLKEAGFEKGYNLDLYYGVCDRLGDAFISVSKEDKEYWMDVIKIFKKRNRILPLFASEMLGKLEKAYSVLDNTKS